MKFMFVAIKHLLIMCDAIVDKCNAPTA